jgi:hypothetical protein
MYVQRSSERLNDVYIYICNWQKEAGVCRYVWQLVVMSLQRESNKQQFHLVTTEPECVNNTRQCPSGYYNVVSQYSNVNLLQKNVFPDCHYAVQHLV